MATEPPLPADPNQTGPVSAPGRDLFGPGGPVRRVLRRWGFPAFVVIMIYFGRRVLLPFVFAALVAYILAPVIRWMAERKDGSRRMPRGLAIIICYLVFIAGVVGEVLILLQLF